MKFTKEEFEDLRNEISAIFSDELGKYFNFTRSTYDWSSKHNFLIQVYVKSNWRRQDKLKPEETIRLLKEMFDSVSNFINDEEKDFSFINVDSKGSFSFSFTFQPTTERVKRLLARGQ